MHILWYQNLFLTKEETGEGMLGMFKLFCAYLFSGGLAYMPWCMCAVTTGQPAGVCSRLLPCGS